MIPESPFHACFPAGRAPVCTASPVPVLIGDYENTMAYFLDVNRCEDETLLRVAAICAQEAATRHTPEEVEALSNEALLQMAQRGLPIRESQVEAIIGGGQAL